VLDVCVPDAGCFDRSGANIEPERSHSSRIGRREAKRGVARSGLDGELIDSQASEVQIRLDGTKAKCDIQRYAAGDTER
jgi:hypothetical protein